MSSPLHQIVQLPNSSVSMRSVPCQWGSHAVPVTVSPFVNFLSTTIPKMFPSVCQDMHGRTSALFFATERASSRAPGQYRAVCRRSPITKWEISPYCTRCGANCFPQEHAVCTGIEAESLLKGGVCHLPTRFLRWRFWNHDVPTACEWDPHGHHAADHVNEPTRLV